MVDPDEVISLCLCEQNWLVLRPDVYYIFRVCDDCDKCQEIADEYEDY